MIRAFSVEIAVDLKPLSQSLWHKGIKHRISEESGNQVVWVADEQQAAYAQQAFNDWSSEPTDSVAQSSESHQTDTRTSDSDTGNGIDEAVQWLVSKFAGATKTAPVSLLIIVICCLVALITNLGAEPYRLSFLFYPSLPYDGLFSLLGGINSLQTLLRTLMPMFLHFGELHIIFNLLWLWFFGRQLETIQTSWQFLLVVIVTSFAANTTQYLSSQAANFGGMSGVVYGLVGYAWILHNFVPGKRMMLNSSIFIVFVIALVLMELIASSWIATAAHIGGLVAGLVAGLIVVGHDRFSGKSAV